MKSHTCSIGFMSGDIAGHGIVWTASCCKKCCTIRALCGLALSSMNIGLSANAWLSKLGTTRGASTLSRYVWPVRLPSRTYKSNLQSKEKQPQTVTPRPPKAVVTKMWLSWNEVFRWRQTLTRPSVGRNKKWLSSDQWTSLHVQIVHPKWSRDQSNRAWRWRNVNCGRFKGRRARHPWWWRRLIKVRVLMWPPNAKLPLSVPAVLNGRCRARLDMSRSSLKSRLARYTCMWTVSNIPRLTKMLHQSYNDGMVNPEVVCHTSMAKTTVMHANSLPPFWYG